jgi:riboflavin biosynthesis pyrimidine reductase
VRQLIPTPVDPVDPIDVYADLPAAAGRPALRLNMIASIDGATAVAGVSGPLGGPADRRVYLTLRALADVILVAAGTVRAERYGAVVLPEELLEARRRRGLPLLPRIAVVSRSCQLDWESPLFAGATARPIVITIADAPPDARARAAAVADVLVAGERDVDLALALDGLGRTGARLVLAEGGPTLNGFLAAAGLLDELCLTVSPLVASGDARRIVSGPPLAEPPRFRLRSLCEEDDFLFLRYRVRPRGEAPAST